MMSPDQKAFENYWKAQHPARQYPRKVWLEQSDVWGSKGYAQPTVHFDWLSFRAGATWQATRR